jgi:hypothetical protein
MPKPLCDALKRWWVPVPIEKVDRETYGDVVAMWKHVVRPSYKLVNIRTLRRGHKQYKAVGMWYVCQFKHVLKRKGYYGREPISVPARWAYRVVIRHRRGNLYDPSFD